jgi:Putative transposase
MPAAGIFWATGHQHAQLRRDHVQPLAHVLSDLCHLAAAARAQKGVTFKYKDYRIEGPARYKTMTLATDEFIRRFLIHVLPKGFHRIRHYGLLATGARAANIAHARELLAVPSRPKEPETPEAAIDEPRVLPRPCPCCGARMIVIETFERGCEPKHRPTPAPAAIRIDTS